ncbi:MAG TPA: type IV pilin protein [Woeseiaceae bacterium]|nr:type IV pilin protein [Woeseiaceae bacterium]
MIRFKYLRGDLMYKHMRGITLIELMIVVVIISILAAVAYPNYQEFSARAKRNEARAALLRLAVNQERFYLNNNTFTSDLTSLGFSTTPTADTESGYYRVTVTAANASNFAATATYLLGGSEAAKCNVFTIDGRGAKTSDPDTDCWDRAR